MKVIIGSLLLHEEGYLMSVYVLNSVLFYESRVQNMKRTLEVFT